MTSAEERKKLPIGMQTFEEIRRRGYVYIDKTRKIHEMITTGKAYFLSRPRRFGKSLLVSTLNEIFNGSKDLFEGLWIHTSGYEWPRRPVIKISLGGALCKTPGDIQDYIREHIEHIADAHGVKVHQNETAPAMRELIRKISKIGKVAVLIDEYDKPLTDCLDDPDLYRENRRFLRSFYSIFKEMDEHTHFIFFTGVSKFSKVGVFSGLNNLKDITMDMRFSDMLGITQKELESCFSDHIRDAGEKEGLGRDALLEKIEFWYNGYRFSEEDIRVYNPFSTLLFLDQKKFSFHWFETGTPAFLINLIKETDYDVQNLERLEVSESSFSSYEIENLAAVPLLFQTGYLTIKDYDAETGLYTLDYPNFEVRNAFETLVRIRNKKYYERFLDQERTLYLIGVEFNADERNIGDFEMEVLAPAGGPASAPKKKERDP
ncbi:conserved hypothetical protein [Candidatus Desulfarcum epimagneticum]|uniref:AAA-ATPase-like domain-containing protein n=1 Tax=uncultured Desulfobacteraceae bacterium TaxID=218296 RepID=A0A484HDP6_9BACT|nr:conserved hypothetical protein [uncultured Desulfobacteraceae bacterium]